MPIAEFKTLLLLLVPVVQSFTGFVCRFLSESKDKTFSFLSANDCNLKLSKSADCSMYIYIVRVVLYLRL